MCRDRRTLGPVNSEDLFHGRPDGNGFILPWNPWVREDGDASQDPASSSAYEDFPAPEYPFAGDRTHGAGQCAEGWIVLEFRGPRKLCEPSTQQTRDKRRVEDAGLTR